ncbi:hypothetical protein GMOD_00006118 [Pyrenophora seminiperda CCB06]|uniref:Uncharacterized protein n=1 Tax=Pyrenophora seminiperda CCB06 TaxID=1302712 RepID=A0A3M7M4F1_9PLEO|nr:hypothetical protein GMOD_00006118 [Pyrenophora seminiperda CCB06]
MVPLRRASGAMGGAPFFCFLPDAFVPFNLVFGDFFLTLPAAPAPAAAVLAFFVHILIITTGFLECGFLIHREGRDYKYCKKTLHSTLFHQQRDKFRNTSRTHTHLRTPRHTHYKPFTHSLCNLTTEKHHVFTNMKFSAIFVLVAAGMAVATPVVVCPPSNPAPLSSLSPFFFIHIPAHITLTRTNHSPPSRPMSSVTQPQPSPPLASSVPARVSRALALAFRMDAAAPRPLLQVDGGKEG